MDGAGMRYRVRKEIILKDEAGRLVQEIELGDGVINKVLERPVCSVCGVVVKGGTHACPNCGKYVCKECAYVVYGYRLCLNCIMKKYELSYEEWLVLRYIADNQDSRLSVRLMARALHMSRRLVRETLRSLIRKRFLSKKGYLFFTEYYVTHLGFEALSILGNIYTLAVSDSRGSDYGFEF